MERILVLGLGNVLLGDEGIGVWVVDSLQRRFEFPESVTVLEGGTLGLDLLPWLEGVERLLVIDAVKFGGEPGQLVRLEGDAVSRVLNVKLSPHQIGVHDLLAAARLTGREPPFVVLWGMEPQRLDPGTGFSPNVEQALPQLVAEVLEELRRWGVRGDPQASAAHPPVWWEEPRVGNPR
jgi:hydrogenase maturation protease